MDDLVDRELMELEEAKCDEITMSAFLNIRWWPVVTTEEEK